MKINCENCRYRYGDMCVKLDGKVELKDYCSWGKPDFHMTIDEAIDLMGEIVTEWILGSENTEENEKLEKAFRMLSDKASELKGELN